MAIERDLNIAVLKMRDFLDAAKKHLESRRSQVAYGKTESKHFIHTQATDPEVEDPQHVVVVIAVRRHKKHSRVYLCGVRQPDEREWTDLGAAPQKPWSKDLTGRLEKFVIGKLNDAISGLNAEPETIYRRFEISYEAVRGIVGEYWYGPWRIGMPTKPPDGTYLSEKILLCDRVFQGSDPFPPMHERDRLAALLSVVWLYYFRSPINTKHVWVFNDSL